MTFALFAFFALAFLSSFAAHFLKFSKVATWASLAIGLLSTILFGVFLCLFLLKTFPDTKTSLINTIGSCLSLACIFLYIGHASLFLPQYGKLTGSIAALLFFGFAVAGLSYLFVLGKVSLGNETVISSSQTALSVLNSSIR